MVNAAGNGMGDLNKRKAYRFDCDYTCLLQYDDIKYQCEVKNISTSGALVEVPFDIPVNIQLGDTCNLVFGAYHSMPPRNFTSKVSRLENSRIALQFLYKTF